MHIHPHCFVVLRDLTSLRCRHIEMWKVRHWNILFGFSGMFRKFSVLVYSGLFRTRISPDGANSWKKTILFFSFIIRYFVAKYWPTPGWDIKVIFLSCWSSGEHLGNFQVGFSRMSEQNIPNKNPWIIFFANQNISPPPPFPQIFPEIIFQKSAINPSQSSNWFNALQAVAQPLHNEGGLSGTIFFWLAPRHLFGHCQEEELYQVNLGVCSPENKSVFSHWESPPLKNNGLAFPRTISHWSSWQEGSNKTFHHYNVRGMFALKPNLVDWPFGSITMPLVCCSLPIAALCWLAQPSF